METVKRIVVSDCCESVVYFFPPSMGDPGIYFCSKCSTECKTKISEVVTHKEIQKGVYRPINNEY